MENKKAPKRLREIPHKRDLFSKHYLNEDGSFTAEISLVARHYKDENEEMQDLSLELFDEDDFDQIDFPVTKHKKASFKAKKEITKGLKEKGGGKLAREDSDFHGLKLPFDATLPKKWRKGYSLGHGSSRLTLKPEGANAAKGIKISANQVKYEGAWNKADVILELKEKGIKETIILQDETAPSIFSFEVTGPLQDDFSAGEIRMDPAWLVDAAGERRDVQTNIRRQGAKVFVDLVADVYGLQYPVEIDPTLSVQPDGTAGIDAYIISSSPNSNYSTQSDGYVGQMDAYVETFRSVLKFDLSSIPSTANVFNALFTYVLTGNSANFGFNTFNFHPLTRAFTESLVTWNSAVTGTTNWTTPGGDYNASVVDSNTVNSNTKYNFIAATITNTIKHLVANGNNGFLWKIANLSPYNDHYFAFATSDGGAYKPSLEVTYNILPSAPTVISPNGGEIWDAINTVSWSNAGNPDDITQLDFNYPSASSLFKPLSSSVMVGQTFKVGTKSILSLLEWKSSTTGASSVFDIELWNITDNVKESTLVTNYNETSATVTNRSASVSGEIKDASKTYAILFVWKSGSSANIYYNGNAYSTYNSFDKTGTTYTYDANNYDLTTRFTFQNSAALQYQVDLSGNNGSTWKTILSLSNAGVTSFNYDFTNEAETTTAKIRVRAHDGSDWGPWDESNAVFTINHNTAPNKPDQTTPAGTSGTPGIVTTLTPALAWRFTDPNSGNTQGSYQVMIYDSSAVLRHDSGKVAGSASSYTVPGGILSWNTKYYWRVKTWDNKDVASVFSDDQYFQPNQAPSITYTSPTGTSGSPTIFNDTVQPTFTWTFSDPNGDTQASIRITIKDGTTTVFDSGEIPTTGSSYQIPTGANLIYDKTYNATIIAKDSKGTWSTAGAATYFHLNRSPGAPINLSPAGSSVSPQVINDNLQPVISGTFTDQDSTDTLGNMKVDIYDGTTLSLIHPSGWLGSMSYTVPGGVLISGKKYAYNMQIKDNHGQAGPSSAMQYFYTNAKPNTPINPSPAGGSAVSPAIVFDDLTPSLSWQYSDPNSGDIQKAFQLKLYNEAGTLLLDTGEILSASGLYTIPQAYKLTYSQKYQWEVRTKDPYDQWSNYTSRGWLTPKVGTPTGLTASADNFGAKIILDWNDSLAEGLQGYNVYRSTSAGGTYTKLNGALVTASQYSDTQVSTGSTYYYKIEAYVNGTEVSALTAAASASAIFSNWYIGDFKFMGPSSMSGSRARAQSKRAVLGSPKKVIQDRGFFGEVLQMSIFLGRDEYSTGKQKFDLLMVELEKTEPLSVRDPFGQVWKVAPGDFSWELMPGSGELTYKVSFPLEEVN